MSCLRIRASRFATTPRPPHATADEGTLMLSPRRSNQARLFRFVCATVVAALLCAPRAALAIPIEGTTCDPDAGGGGEGPANADVLFPGAAFACESRSA